MKFTITIPNILTSARLFLIPFIVVFFLYDSLFSRIALLTLIIISELTDLFDGILARKRGEVTDFGKILDPMADRISHMTTLVCLAYIDLVSFYLILPIIYRESIISSLRPVCASQGVVLAARMSGKVKSFLQASVIIIILLCRVIAFSVPAIDEKLYWIANSLVGISCLVTVYSAYDYLRFILPRILVTDSRV